MAEVEEGGLRADARGLLHGMGDDDHGKLAAQVVDRGLDLSGGDGVKGGTGFVHQQHFGAGGDSAGDAETLLLAAGQTGAGGGKAVFHLVPEVGAVQGSFDHLVQVGLVSGQAVDAMAFMFNGFRAYQRRSNRRRRRRMAAAFMVIRKASSTMMAPEARSTKAGSPQVVKL